MNISTLSFADVFNWLGIIAAWQIYGVSVCRMLAFPIAIVIFTFSRLLSMPLLKVMGLAIGLIMYSFPEILKWMSH